jgi:hypothetical protein
VKIFERDFFGGRWYLPFFESSKMSNLKKMLQPATNIWWYIAKFSIAFVLTTACRFKTIAPCPLGDQEFEIPVKEKGTSWQKKSVRQN